MSSARIHATAVIAPEAELADDVDIGPYVVIEGPVQIGPGCVLRPYCHLIGPLRMGQGNMVFSGAVLGERPQHMKYAGEPTRVEIGDHNVFRENVTVHRGTTCSGCPGVTRIGSQNFFMAGSHVAHDCIVGNRCILVNGALIGGHCELEDGVYLSGNSAVHQFCRVGKLAMLSGCSGTSKDVPPFVLMEGSNSVGGINVVGMRRAGCSQEQINAVNQAYRILFRKGLSLPSAITLLERDMGHIDVIRDMIQFLHKCKRGINPIRERSRFAA
jgi:UDP-N-acetylglucosamine acyltransferase